MSSGLSAVREEGFRILLKELGSVGTVDFIRQFEDGRGNYTEERQRMLETNSIDEIVLRIKERKQRGT